MELKKHLGHPYLSNNLTLTWCEISTYNFRLTLLKNEILAEKIIDFVFDHLFRACMTANSCVLWLQSHDVAYQYFDGVLTRTHCARYLDVGY